MGRKITLTNRFCKTSFKMYIANTPEQLKELEDNKYTTSAIKIMHWKLFFIEVARINSFDKNSIFESHTYSKAELLKKLGIKKNYSLKELHSILETVSMTYFRFENEKKIDTYTMMRLISTDLENGTITLAANDLLKKFLLIGDVRDSNNEEGFIQFNEDILLSFKSIYAVRLYLYLSAFKNVSTTALSFDNIYKLLNIHEDYARKDLWRNIIIKACKEISDKTELNIIPIAKKRATGKEMTSVTFTIQSKAVVKKELNIELLIKSFIERKSIKIAAPEIKKEMGLHVSTIKMTLDGVYNCNVNESDIYKAIGYCGGDIKMAGNLFGQAIKDKAGSKVGYVRAKAKKENIIPLKMYK